jgi:hypothetical protein
VATLPEDCVLVRTADGTRKMRSHAAGITPKLRSVLFLIDGVQPAKKILERAGSLRPLLESQLDELLRLGLVQTVSGAANSSQASAKKPVAAPECEAATATLHSHVIETADGIPPIVGAKMELLKMLESLEGHELVEYATPLIEARCWRELASRSKDLSHTLKVIAGAEVSAVFWARAKFILTGWRGKEISPQQR